MSKETILKELKENYGWDGFETLSDIQNELIGDIISATKEETIREAIRKIEKIKIAVAKQAGAFKYDSCYEDCIDILNKLKK